MIQSHCNITTPPFGEDLLETHQACLKSVWTLLEAEASSVHHHPNHHHLHIHYVNTKLSPYVSPVCEYWKHHVYLQYGNIEIIIISIFGIEILNHHHLHLQYVNTETLSSASSLVCRKTGFLCALIYHGILCSLSSIYNFDYHIESR